MQYSLKFTIIEPTDALKAAVEAKMQHIEPRVEKYGDAASAEVELSKTTEHHHKGDIFRAEIRLQLPGNNMYAEALHEDLYAAIGDVTDNILRQLGDYKESLEDTKHQPRPDKE